MQPDRWRHIKRILYRVTEAPAWERDRILREECETPEVRADVESFLAHDLPSVNSGSMATDGSRDVPNPSSGSFESERFDIRRPIGEGAYGDVFEAYDRKQRAVVALKRLRRVEPRALYNFKQGFRALRQVEHRNLVRLYELIEERGSWLLTMELIDGVNFLHYVREQGAAERRWDRLWRALLELAEGICKLHESAVLHRDIKPGNVLVTSDGRVVLVDFGLAAPREFPSELGPVTLAGTPAYIAPELISRTDPTEASDWYSVGVMLFQALTGRLPFPDDPIATILEARSRDVEFPADAAAVAPPPLVDLCMALLRREPGSRPTCRQVLRTLRADGHDGDRHRTFVSGRDALVGRSAQLTALETALATSREGHTVTVHVQGSSGVGKTTLVTSFLRAVCDREPEVLTLTGRCHSAESVPYKALDELVDHLVRYLASVPAHDAEILLPQKAGLLPTLFPVLGRIPIRELTSDPVEAGDSLERRRRAFGAFRELFGRLTERRAVILFIDDIQWSDGDSLALLRELVAPPDAPCLLLVLAYRADDVGSKSGLSAIETLGGDGRRLISLADLSFADSVALATTLVADESIPDRSSFARTIAQESGGNPFFVQELVRHATVRAATDSPNVRLDQLIADRVVRLPTHHRNLLEVVAVAGEPVAVAVSRAAAGLTEEFQEASVQLVKEHLLRDTGTEQTQLLDVYHDQVRQAIVALIPPARLQRHHERLAMELEAHRPADADRPLNHYLAAGNRSRAAHLALHAAEWANAAFAFGRAVELYRLTLELDGGSRRDRARLRESLARALANAGRGGEAARAYVAAAAEAEPQHAFALRRRAAEQWIKSGHLNDGVGLLQTLCREVGLWFPARQWQAHVAVMLGRLRVTLSRLRFRERPDATIAARTVNQLELCWAAALGLSLIDPFRTIHFHAQFLALSRQAGDRVQFAKALAAEIAIGAMPGGARARERGERLYARAKALARGDSAVQAFCESMRGTMYWLIGDWAAAYESSEIALKLLEQQPTESGWEATSAHIRSIGSLAMMGRWEDVTMRLPPLLAKAKERDDVYASVGLRLMPYPYLAWLAADEPERAEREILLALEEWPSQGYDIQQCDALFGRTDIALYCGDGIAALNLMRDQWSDLSRSLLLQAHLPRTFAYALRGRAALAAAGQVSGGRARKPLLRIASGAARRIEQDGMHWSQGWATLLSAGVAAGQGDGATAANLLEQAEMALANANMPQFRAAAQRRRGELTETPEGKQLFADAGGWMQSRGVRRPDRLTAMLVPLPDPHGAAER